MSLRSTRLGERIPLGNVVGYQYNTPYMDTKMVMGCDTQGTNESQSVGMNESAEIMHTNHVKKINEIEKTTLLHLASAFNHQWAVYWLAYEAGCDCFAVDSEGHTPRDVATCAETIDLLNRLEDVQKNRQRGRRQ